MNQPRVFRIESKSFSVRRDSLSQGGTILITEKCRGKSYLISLEVDCVVWLRAQLHDASKGGEAQFFRRFKSDSFLVWIERHRNSNGWFLRVSKCKGGVVRSLVIPQGHKAVGWRAMEESLGSCLNVTGERWGPVTGHRAGGSLSSPLSFRDAVKGDKGVKAGSLGYPEGVRHDWSLTVLIERLHVHLSWKVISGALAEVLGKPVRISPFQPSKAILECDNREEMLLLLRKGNWLKGDPIQISVSEWDLSWGLKDTKVVSYGGWVAVYGLPLNWWKPNFFSQVGEACGGLLQVDQETENFQCLYEAKIKVKENAVGFLPRFVRVSDGKETVVVTLSPISPAIRPTCRGNSGTIDDEDRRRWKPNREGGSVSPQISEQNRALPRGRAGEDITQRVKRMTAADRVDIKSEGVRLEVGCRAGHSGSRDEFSDFGGLGDAVFVKGSEAIEEGTSIYREEDFYCDIWAGAELEGPRLGLDLAGPKGAIAKIDPGSCGGYVLERGPTICGPKPILVDCSKHGGSILGAGPVSNQPIPKPSLSCHSEPGPSVTGTRVQAKPSSSASSFLSKYGNREGASTLRRLDPKCFGGYRAKEVVASSCSSDDDVETNFTDGIESEMGVSTVFGDDCDLYGDEVSSENGTNKDFDDTDASQQGEGEALDISLCEDGMLEKLFEESPQAPNVATNQDRTRERDPQLRTYYRRRELSLVPGKNKFKAKNNGILSKMGISLIPLKKSLIIGKNGGLGFVSKMQGGEGGS